MKFRLTGDLPRIQALLDKFIAEAKVEYEKQTGAVKTLGIVLPPFMMVYTVNEKNIELVDTMPEPPLPGFMKARMRMKAAKNLEAYLKAQGVEAKAEGF